MPYRMGDLPLSENWEELIQFLRQEFSAIEQSQAETEELELRVRNVEPERPREGMKVYADGTNWDPGDGEGSYTYTSGGWVKEIVSDDLGLLAYQDEVELGDIEDITADRILGRTGTAGTVEELTLGTGLSFNGNAIDVTGNFGSKIIRNWFPYDASFPATNYPKMDLRNTHPVLDFDTTTQETVYFHGVMPDNYDGEGVTVELWWTAENATSGTIGWDISFEKMDGLDVDSDSFAAAQTVTAVTVPVGAGTIESSTLNISDGANMDSLVAGDLFRIRVRRDVGNDTATGDAELHAVELRIQ